MDGDPVNVEAIPYGTYRYTAVIGAAKTCALFNYTDGTSLNLSRT
jgi:hypothetical protein